MEKGKKAHRIKFIGPETNVKKILKEMIDAILTLL
jgi:hypothetical protein